MLWLFFFFLREIQEDEKVEQALTDGKSTVNWCSIHLRMSALAWLCPNPILPGQAMALFSTKASDQDYLNILIKRNFKITTLHGNDFLWKHPWLVALLKRLLSQFWVKVCWFCFVGIAALPDNCWDQRPDYTKVAFSRFYC